MGEKHKGCVEKSRREAPAANEGSDVVRKDSAE